MKENWLKVEVIKGIRDKILVVEYKNHLEALNRLRVDEVFCL
jgi:hypothetical protein